MSQAFLKKMALPRSCDDSQFAIGGQMAIGWKRDGLDERHEIGELLPC